MPLLTRLYIKCSLLYLGAALVIDLGRTFPIPGQLSSFFSRLRPVYFHLFLVGWVTLFIIGVANWLFPRASREQFNHHPFLAWSAFGLLNLGLILRTFLEPTAAGSNHLASWLLVLSGLTQWVGGLLVIIQLGARIKNR